MCRFNLFLILGSNDPCFTAIQQFTFTFFLLKKTSVIYQLSFVVFIYAFHLEISSFFGKNFLFLFLFLCYLYLDTFPIHVVYRPWSARESNLHNFSHISFQVFSHNSICSLMLISVRLHPRNVKIFTCSFILS